MTADWVHLCIKDATRPRALRLRLAAAFKLEAQALAEEALLAGDLPPEATELLDAWAAGDLQAVTYGVVSNKLYAVMIHDIDCAIRVKSIIFSFRCLRITLKGCQFRT